MRIELAYPLKAKDVAIAMGAKINISEKENTTISVLTTDSREIREGDCFIALCGERFDGNAYLGEAYEKGCIAAIGRGALPKASENRLFLYSADTTAALGRLAGYYASLFPHKTIGVTGSVGKTTTKEFLHAVLKDSFRVHKTSGNYNNELGLPYTILSAPKDTEILILEMGMSGLREIALLSEIARPDIGIITTIGTSHLEHLHTRENICRAKMEITEGMRNDALLLLSGDEPLLLSERSHPLAPRFISVNGEGDYRAERIHTSANETIFDAVIGELRLTDLSIPMAGTHAVHAALFAVAVALELGLSEDAVRRGIRGYAPSGMRQNARDITVCGKRIHLIEDCYNAAPESMRAALSVCVMHAKENGGRAVCLLGDMKELGENSHRYHCEVGAFAASEGVSLLFTYGELALSIAEGAIASGMDGHCVRAFVDSDARQAASAIAPILNEGDTLLVKASRAMRAEDVISALEAL